MLNNDEKRRLFEILLKLGVINGPDKEENVKMFLDSWPKDNDYKKWLQTFNEFFDD